MHYARLGNSGLAVSPIALGCMSYGGPDHGKHDWTLDEDQSRPFLRKALDLGINFFDTANVYSAGTSEEIVGRALNDFVDRHDVVIATKVFGRTRPGPNGAGLSRKNIMAEIDNSLRRLGTDYIDLYQIHFWDNDTPIEETLEALHDIVKAGKVRYLGACNLYAWQFAKALYLADAHGWTRFVSLQNHLNLMYREEEREMLPLCWAEGIAVIPFSPLARGQLARPWSEGSPRSSTDEVSRRFYGSTAASDQRVLEHLTHVAKARGVPQAQVALAWVMRTKGVVAPIVGATKMHHLEDAVAALDLHLTQEEIGLLEEPYIPHQIVGLR